MRRDRDELVERSVSAFLGYLELGNTVIRGEWCTIVRNDDWPSVTDSNHVASVRARTSEEVEEAFREIADRLSTATYSAFRIDPLTAPAVEARLLADDYRSGTDLHLVLSGPIQPVSAAAEVDIRPVATEADWETLFALKRADHAESSPDRPDDLSRALSLAKRAKAPDVTYFLASADGVDCAFFSSWPGNNGVGIVEDLYTSPEFRRRGIASALLSHAASHARGLGADHLVISADPTDSPKDLYRSVGFAPLFVIRGYWKDRSALQSKEPRREHAPIAGSTSSKAPRRR